MREAKADGTKTSRSKDGELYPCGLSQTQTSSFWRLVFSYKILLMIGSSLMLAMLGSAARGDILLFVVMLWKNWEQFHFMRFPVSITTEQNNLAKSIPVPTLVAASNASVEPSALDSWLESHYLKDVSYFMLSAIVTSYAVFFVIGGYLQWTYYVKRRDHPEEWKCQPDRFLTYENEQHEILLGLVSLFFNASFSGIFTAYIYNAGPYLKVYYDLGERGWLYFAGSTVVYFMLQDAFSYYYHRMLHIPVLYRNFHKWHHRYHSPTAFSAVAMHPVESIVFQMFLILPIFIIPVHVMTVIGCSYYLYYFGLIDHSGIDMDSIWPWQPPVLFHDDHHKYFHCNFGFNTLIFDKLHGTLRVKDRVYGEKVFGGKGRVRTAKDE